MAKRVDLQYLLEELLQSKEVYYQKPSDRGMSYPAIIYSKNKIVTKKADDAIYHKCYQYEMTLISRTPDHPIIEKLLNLSYCSYDRQYKSNGLYHDVFTIYY